LCGRVKEGVGGSNHALNAENRGKVTGLPGLGNRLGTALRFTFKGLTSWPKSKTWKTKELGK